MRARLLLVFWLIPGLSAATISDLRKARDRQDRAGLEKLLAGFEARAQKSPGDASAQYEFALGKAYLAEVALELRQRPEARAAAEAGIQAAEKAVALKPDSAEYHRVLGMLCGQVIPANILAGLKYGKCAIEEVSKAVELDPKSAEAWLSRGVGNYYLPPQFGGGIEQALEDIRKAIELDARLADAHLWLGVALRRANNHADARKALEKSLELNPHRVWTKQLLEKTPR